MIKEIILYPDGRLVCGEHTMRCALGPNGVTSDKKEGDGCTPAGAFPLRKVFYRSDRVHRPESALPLEELTQEDGWCTEPSHLEYNALVTLPHAGMHEALWREDHVYDIVVPLGYNDSPTVPGKGSAIFMHLAREDYAPTEGCVAVALSDMFEILRSVSVDAAITIQA